LLSLAASTPRKKAFSLVLNLMDLYITNFDLTNKSPKNICGVLDLILTNLKHSSSHVRLETLNLLIACFIKYPDVC
jgi:hypothetical protein